MRLIVRQLMLTLASLAAIYLSALGLSFVIYPSEGTKGGLDVWSAPDSLYMTMPRYALLNLGHFKEPGQKVIVVGASNAGVTFRQQGLQSRIACAKIYNYGIGGANISQVAETVDLISTMQDSALRHDDLFVIAVWYGMFGDSAAHWQLDFRRPGDTDLDLELYRYGFYRRSPDGPKPNFSSEWFPFAVTAVRPYLAIEHLLRDVTASVRARFLVRTPSFTDAQREAAVISEAQKKEMFAYWHKSMGGDRQISAQQAQVLSDTIARLLANGSKVIILDLPIPRWHAAGSPYTASYTNAIDQVRERFEKDSRFSFMQMADLNEDQDFSDEVHPKPHHAEIWRQRLAAKASSILCPGVQQTMLGAP